MKDTVIFNEQEHELEYDVLAPGIYVYRNVIKKEWDLINRVNDSLSKPGTRFEWKQAGLGYGDTNLEHRLCKDFKIDENILSPRDEYSADMLDLHKQIIDAIKLCLHHYNPRNHLSKIEHFECINIVRYGKGQYFKVHTDDGDPYRCTVSTVGYPNDDYAGGELYFPLFDVKHKPTAGDLVISPSAYVYAHSSEPVTDDGIKYSLVTMTDRNSFAHRNDSPIYHSQDLRQQYNV
jgi:hypothetical protein